MRYMVTESVAITLDGERYLLEKGDIVVIDDVISEGVFDVLMDIGGLIPGIGEPIDFVNGVRHLLGGNLFYAAVSFVSMVPGAGDSAKILKYVSKAGKGGAKVSKAVAKILPKIDELWGSAGKVVHKLLKDDKVRKILAQSDDLKKAADGVVDNWDKMGDALKSQLTEYAKQAPQKAIDATKKRGEEKLQQQKSQKTA